MLAVVLPIPEEFAGPFWEVRRGLSPLLSSPLLKGREDGDYRPHLTLATYHDNDFDTIAQNVGDIAKSWQPVSVEFDSVASLFRREAVALLARPRRNELLRVMQTALVTEYPSVNSYDSASEWEPHATLARKMPINNIGSAMTSIAQCGWKPFTVVLDRVEIVSVGPDREPEALWCSLPLRSHCI